LRAQLSYIYDFKKINYVLLAEVPDFAREIKKLIWKKNRLKINIDNIIIQLLLHELEMVTMDWLVTDLNLPELVIIYFSFSCLYCTKDGYI